jgi:hypothetical protein
MGKAHQRYASEKDPAAAAPLFQAYLRVVAAVTALSKAAPKSDIETGNAIPASEVDATWSRHVKEWRTMLENLPRRAAMSPLFKRLDPVDVEQLLDKEVAQILVHLEASDKGWMKDKP